MALQECQAKHTSSEFLLWKAFLEMQPNDFHREDYYFAKICVILKALYFLWAGKETNLPTINEELIKFESSKEVTTKEVIMTGKKKKKKVTRKQLEASKLTIFAAVGLNPDGSLPDEPTAIKRRNVPRQPA